VCGEKCWESRQPPGERGARVAVARTHGDLWCGNVLWTPADEAAQWAPPRAGLGPQASSSGEALAGGSTSRATVVGVLIDPMAQGAHAETDLAALGVFGQRYLDRIYAAYHEVSPLAAGWRERVGLHSWHIIMIHAFLFGGGYGGEAGAELVGRHPRSSPPLASSLASAGAEDSETSSAEATMRLTAGAPQASRALAASA